MAGTRGADIRMAPLERGRDGRSTLEGSAVVEMFLASDAGHLRRALNMVDREGPWARLQWLFRTKAD